MKKLFSLTVILAFLLSACGGTNPPTPTQPAFLTPPATQTSITTQPPTISVTNQAGCVNSAAFVADVSVPDNSNFKQGEKFNKVWRVQNTGTCTWTPDYTLVFSDGDQMGRRPRRR